MTHPFTHHRRQCLHGVGAVAISSLLPILSAHAQGGTQPPALMLAAEYSERFALDGVLVSEKLDGVRAYWDGQRLVTRGGNPIHAPGWFIAGWPTHAMDGELWAGRGGFEDAVSTVRRQVPDDAAWRGLRYMVFDLPARGGPFEARASAVQVAVARLHQPWVQAVEQAPVTDTTALHALLDRIVAAGGEGLMLHRSSSVYAPGRSAALVKFKLFLDAEAQVVEHLPGMGRLQGSTGALVVEWLGAAGIKPKRFKLGTGLTDADRRDPPPVGSWVTFRYRGLTEQGVPRFASYLRAAAARGL